MTTADQPLGMFYHVLTSPLRQIPRWIDDSVVRLRRFRQLLNVEKCRKHGRLHSSQTHALGRDVLARCMDPFQNSKLSRSH